MRDKYFKIISLWVALVFASVLPALAFDFHSSVAPGSDGEIVYNSGGSLAGKTVAALAAEMGVNPEKVYTISPSGGDYTTIQAALTANSIGGELFLAYPGAYTDTIAFSASNQCIVGMGTKAQVIVAQATANVVNVAAYTGCRIQHIHLRVTAATSAIDTVLVSTGSVLMRDVKIEMTNFNVTTADQPSCVEITGAGTVEISKDSVIDYNNAVTDGDGATAIKAAVRTGAGSSFTISRSEMDVDGSGQSMFITPLYSPTTGVYYANRCNITVNDTGASFVDGMYLPSSGTSEFNYNDVTVVAGGVGKEARGLQSGGSVIVNASYNHISVTDGGGTSRGFYVGAGTTINSKFNSITAADGNNVIGVLNFIHSPSNGEFALSGLTASQAVVTDANKKLSSKAIGISDDNIVEIDHAGVVNTDYAKFTANGLEGRSASEAFGDIKQVATDSATGVSELATNAETATGTATNRVTTPANIAAVYQYGTIYIDAAAMIPCTTNGALQGTHEYGTNDIDIDYFAFDPGATEERIQFKLKMDENWDRSAIKAKFDWSSDTGSTATDTCQWGIKGQAISDSDLIDVAFGDAGEVIGDVLLADNGTDMQTTVATPSITVGGTPALGDVIVFEVWRDTSVDNMAEDAWLFSVTIQYKKTNTVSVW